MTASGNLRRYIEIDDHDAHVTYGWDEDADILFVRLMDRELYTSTIDTEMNKIVWYDREGTPVDIDILYCSEGITLEDVPETLKEHVRAAARELGISLMQR